MIFNVLEPYHIFFKRNKHISLITHNIHLQESIICGEKENTDNPCYKKLIWAKAPWTYIISSETILNKLKKKD